jgi:hypothetical protein
MATAAVPPVKIRTPVRPTATGDRDGWAMTFLLTLLRALSAFHV